MGEDHRRVLRSGLLVIERQLHQIVQELQLRDGDTDSILQSIVIDIDPEARKRILDVVTSMLDEIKQVKKEFDLELEERSLRWRIVSKSSEIWKILEDLRPDKMSRSFGLMPDNAKDAWKPHLARLLEMTDEIDRELG